jgi:hypothetical protein
VLDYRPAGSAGSAGEASRETMRHVQQAFVFFGLLGFGVGLFGGFSGSAVTIPDGQRVLGSLMLLSCAMGYVVVRSINSTASTFPRIALSLSSAGAIFGAAVACTCRFPDRPLDNPGMLASGVAVVVVGVASFAAARVVMRRSAAQSFEK